MLAEAKAAFLQDLLHQVGHQLTGEISLQRQLDTQGKDRLEAQLREVKEELRLDRHRSEERVKALLLERSELEAACHLARDQLETVKRARDQECLELREELRVARERA